MVIFVDAMRITALINRPDDNQQFSRFARDAISKGICKKGKLIMKVYSIWA